MLKNNRKTHSYCSGQEPNRYLFKGSVHMLVILFVLFSMCGTTSLEFTEQQDGCSGKVCRG